MQEMNAGAAGGAGKTGLFYKSNKRREGGASMDRSTISYDRKSSFFSPKMPKKSSKILPFFPMISHPINGPKATKISKKRHSGHKIARVSRTCNIIYYACDQTMLSV